MVMRFPLAFLLDDQSVYQVSSQLEIVFGHLPNIIRNLSYFCMRAGEASMLHNPSGLIHHRVLRVVLGIKGVGWRAALHDDTNGKGLVGGGLCLLGQLIYNYS